MAPSTMNLKKRDGTKRGTPWDFGIHLRKWGFKSMLSMQKIGICFYNMGKNRIHEFYSLNTEFIKNREDLNHMLPF